ncbi:hypothetical protein Poli38472_009722 [Pythium oligandrum]|uniref:SBF1/SBF2 domain-containing protein n=1 Tax=Pythium oligandrum TaxID=41045 RepID=A0A8K1CEY9_PYTOL|nr:hypothetical protein Poli38472_009722 [Pythium oligandrum]|eukprot:TMW62229.1 hypothetical protein Poli38472_009722 [Pythium oligandrum]
MLGERPTPMRGGTGAPTFRQVPFVRVNERVESGVKVRKQLRKYLKASSNTQHLVAQMHLNDACVTAMQPQEVAQSCYEAFFAQMKVYNQVVGQKYMEASKAMMEMSRPLDYSGKSKKWAKDVYNLVQRCVQDVNMAEKKMEKAKLRKERADDDLAHWKRVLEANEATYQVQPNNPEVQRAYQTAQTRFTNAFAEEEAAAHDFEDAKAMFYASLERRDQVVEEATELSQSVEEDRLETMLIVMKQFVQTKKAILQAEIEALSKMQQILVEMDRESVIQQYIVEAMQPDLTHRHAKAMYLLEWHWIWHREQVMMEKQEPSNYLTLTTPEDIAKVKKVGMSATDVEVIKDFIIHCFVDGDRSILNSTANGTSKPISTKHRNRFTDPHATGLYRMPVVRRVMLSALQHQRTHNLELTSDGYVQLATAMRMILNACSETDDAKTIRSVMNLSQTFYRVNSGSNKEYVLAAILDHGIWSIPQFWGNALLITIGDELSKMPQETPWYFLSSQDRTQLVLHMHNMVYGQVMSFVYNLESFGFSRQQIQQYAQNVCFAYELAEDQRISLLATVESLTLDDSQIGRLTRDGDLVQFTSSTLPDWTYLCNGMQSSEKFRPFRSNSATSETVRSTESSGFSVLSATSSSTGVRDIEEMKLRASELINSSAPPQSRESWKELFGAGPVLSTQSSTVEDAPNGAGVDVDEDKPKQRPKSRKSSRSHRSVRSASLNDDLYADDWTTVEVQKTAPVHTATATATPLVGLSTVSNGQPPELTRRSSRQAMDDTSLLLSEEADQRHTRQKRLIKARSAANIDTSMLREMQPSPAPYNGPGGGMDQNIRSIAAQMKQRRETASARSIDTKGIALAPSLSSNSNGNALASAKLRKAHSSFEPTTRAPPDNPPPPASSDTSSLSGVAALRARFERKG